MGGEKDSNSVTTLLKIHLRTWTRLVATNDPKHPSLFCLCPGDVFIIRNIDIVDEITIFSNKGIADTIPQDILNMEWWVNHPAIASSLASQSCKVLQGSFISATEQSYLSNKSDESVGYRHDCVGMANSNIENVDRSVKNIHLTSSLLSITSSPLLMSPVKLDQLTVEEFHSYLFNDKRDVSGSSQILLVGYVKFPTGSQHGRSIVNAKAARLTNNEPQIDDGSDDSSDHHYQQRKRLKGNELILPNIEV
jgi:hypothetical protein